MRPDDSVQTGLVVATHGRHVVVESPDGSRRICHPKGKKNTALVGDHVHWRPSGDEGRIEAVDARRNLLYRQDDVRTKSFAANIDQVLILLAAEPDFSESQLSRALIAAEDAKIEPLIVLNKSDLTEAFGRAWLRLAPYREMGYAVLPLCLKSPDQSASSALSTPSQSTLDTHIRLRKTLVLGPSGVGKSTLINHWVPHASALTNEISRALNSGKHTTTSTLWYWLGQDRQTALIDSPGFQEFGLRHIDANRLASLMPDFSRHLGTCKFYNCTHRHEPGCMVKTEVENNASACKIYKDRYKIYCDLFDELTQSTSW